MSSRKINRNSLVHLASSAYKTKDLLHIALPSGNSRLKAILEPDILPSHGSTEAEVSAGF
jgi:hypothetical protein